MNKFILALVLIAIVNSHFLPAEEEKMFLFTRFLQQHDKHYDSVDEFRSKFEIFKTNLEKINDTESFSPFMDQTEEEFNSRLNLDVSAISLARSKMETYRLKKQVEVEDLPASFDWREKGAVAPVKDQGQCGSCWAFSAVANIESQNFIVNGELETLAEQQLVDCDSLDGGCNGGWMDNAFKYFETRGPVSDKEYKYTARGGSCEAEKFKSVVEVTAFNDISQNEDEIQKVLVENGPLSIACNASPWMFYSGGVLRPTKESCNPSGINHGITLVGYGEESGVKFWIIRNSWGVGWGEKGHIRIERGTGACGCNTVVSTSVVKKNK